MAVAVAAAATTVVAAAVAAAMAASVAAAIIGTVWKSTVRCGRLSTISFLTALF